MRITNSMLVRDMLWNANKNLVSMSARQKELSSGKRIQKASDDPVGTTMVIKYKTDIAEAEQYKKNIQSGLGWMEVSESSMMNIKELLQRIRELTVRGANGTNTAEDTQKIKSEITQLSEELLVLGNSTNAGRYIFSGLETNEKLFNKDGTYNVLMTSERVSSKPVPAYEVAIGEVLDMGTHPIDIFGIVDNNSFFDGKLNFGNVESSYATRTSHKFNLGFLADTKVPFPNEDLSIAVNGVTYTIPAAELAETPTNPMTKERFIDALNGAVDAGSNPLSSVARSFFNENSELVVEARDYGAITVGSLSNTSSTGYTSLGQNLGADASGVSFSTNAMTDAEVTAATGSETIVITLDAKQYALNIDMSTVTTVAGLATAVQNQITAVLPAGTNLTVTGSNGNPLAFNFQGPNDGKPHVMGIDYVVSNESEMIRDLKALAQGFETKDDPVIQVGLSNIDKHLNVVLTALGELGGKTNRIEYIKARVDENKITFTGLLSKVQDVDMAEAIMHFKNLENIYRASLSVGSKVIQPSLVDFIR